jgi:hypothetical protein
MAEPRSGDSPPLLPIENIETATFKCVFPVCGGLCCKNGRPPVERAEAKTIAANLSRFIPHLRPVARKFLEKRSWLTKRKKNSWLTKRIAAGCRTIAVVDGWCVFFNEGCTLQKVGIAEGEPWKYKPSVCIRFPLVKTRRGQWFVRQRGYRGEVWDLFCLNPDESSTKASQSLADEIRYSATREARLKSR